MGSEMCIRDRSQIVHNIHQEHVRTSKAQSKIAKLKLRKTRSAVKAAKHNSSARTKM